jgi:hypothetical protein
MVREPETLYTKGCGKYYDDNSTAAIYSKMVSDLMQETTEDQLVPEDNSAYPMQQGADQNTVHDFIEAQSANPQTVKGDTGGVENILPGDTAADLSSLHDDEYHAISQNNIASPITVLWLMQNYEAAKGMSLAFSTVYEHYLCHCKENKLIPVNQSLFGKLFRSVFLGLNTRRIGTRCNTKYYYYGIRVIPGSALSNLLDGSKSAVHQQTSPEESNTILSGSESCGNGTQKIENEYVQNTYNPVSSDHSYSTPLYPHQNEFLGQSEPVSEFPDTTFPLGVDLGQSKPVSEFPDTFPLGLDLGQSEAVSEFPDTIFPLGLDLGQSKPVSEFPDIFPLGLDLGQSEAVSKFPDKFPLGLDLGQSKPVSEFPDTFPLGLDLGQSESVSEFPDATSPLGLDLPDEYLLEL